MTEPDNFLERWSKRKLASQEPSTAERTAAAEPPRPNHLPAAPAPLGEAPRPPAEPFDLPGLPSLDSIDANTPVAAFLRPGVPSELTREALRRAWTSDPAIRDFKGLVENGW